jgi:hypothetical protein
LSYCRVSILGTFASEEVWSINPVFDPTLEFPGGVDQANLDAACLAIANRTVPATLREALSTSASRTGARIEVRDDVTDNLIGISVQGSTTPQPGTGTLKMPPQSAIVLSVRTNTPGGSGRGRLYWPAGGAVLSSTGRITAPTTATFVADFKSYLLGMRSDLATAFPTIGFDLAVRSKTTHTTPHAVRIQAGNIVDTQRRRRDNLPEAYSALAFP